MFQTLFKNGLLNNKAQVIKQIEFRRSLLEKYSTERSSIECMDEEESELAKENGDKWEEIFALIAQYKAKKREALLTRYVLIPFCIVAIIALLVGIFFEIFSH